MSLLPTEYAEELHNGQLQPFSMFCCPGEDVNILRVSALTDEASVIPAALSGTDTIRVFGTSGNIRILHTEPASAVSLDYLRDVMKQRRKYRLRFVTPAMYRSGGHLQCLPIFSAYFESVIQKLSRFENVRITREQVDTAFSSARILEYALNTAPFLSGNRSYPGMTGSLDILLPDGETGNILRTILAYATYSGVGGQTTQGMGGFTAEPI